MYRPIVILITDGGYETVTEEYFYGTEALLSSLLG